MKKLLVFLSAVVLILGLASGVSAATGASSVSAFATVATDESCQITVSATLHLEAVMQELTFPLPAQATNITVNGSRAHTSRSGNVRQIDLSKVVGNMLGDFTLSIHYTLPDVVSRNEQDNLVLQLPLLSGFGYSISNMDFSVTLPGQITGDPVFSSGYHQADIEKDMTFTVDGAVISGKFHAPLKDHETLMLTMGVTEEMFPQPAVQLQNTDVGTAAMGICAALALLYWLIFLRALPLWRQTTPQPPQGHTAGALGSVLCQQGNDLTLTVLTWAQLGYLQLQLDRNQRVILHKQMEMGNERSEAEQRIWRSLFGKRQSVDTSGVHYAQLCRIVAKKRPGLQELLRSSSGNPGVFRALMSGVGLFGGACIGLLLAGGSALSGLWIFLLAALGGLSCWILLDWGSCLFLRRGKAPYLYLGICLFWLILGFAAEAAASIIWILPGILLAGLLNTFGGRRTALGRQTACQILGLRRYLCTVSKTELQRICKENPEYYYQLAPYALALNVNRRFARRFGGISLPGCPYIRSSTDAQSTASQWGQRLELVVQQMDWRAKRLPLEKLLEFIGSLKK